MQRAQVLFLDEGERLFLREARRILRPFSKRGISCETVLSVEQALEAIHSASPEMRWFVLAAYGRSKVTDPDCPSQMVFPGALLLRKLRERFSREQMNVVLCAAGSDMDRELMLSAGADACIEGALDEDGLRELFQTFLETTWR